MKILSESRNDVHLLCFKNKEDEKLEEAINPLYKERCELQVSMTEADQSDAKLEGSTSEHTSMSVKTEEDKEENRVRSRAATIKSRQNSLCTIQEKSRSGSITEQNGVQQDAKYAESVKEQKCKETISDLMQASFVPQGWVTEDQKVYETGTRETKDIHENRLKELPRSATGIKKRIYVCALAFMNYTFYLLLRSNIIVGMDAMVNNTALMEDDNNSNTEKSNRLFGIQDEPIDGDYIWSLQVQSLIISSFYWGYAITNIPGGMFADTYGSKHLLTFGLIISGVCMLLVPFAASIDPSFLIIIRFIMGFSQGPSNPATHSILAIWIPEDERTRFTTIAFSGTTCGTMLSDFITGIIIKYIGYEANSYILGSITILWAIAWERLFSNLPENYKGISEDEKHYLIQCRQKSKPNLRTPPTPWRSIILSVPLWAAVSSQALFEWYAYTYKTHFPIYISNVIGLEGTAGGLVFTISSCMMFITNCLIGVKSDTRIKNGVVSRTKQRKQATLFFQWGSAFFLVAICYCDVVGAFVPLFVVLSLCSGGTSAGYLVNYIDLAPNYAGTLVAIGNTVTTCLTLAAHECFKALLSDPNLSTLQRWHSIIWICALVTFLGGIIYQVFGSGKQQTWNTQDNIKAKQKRTNTVYSIDL